MPKDIDDFSKKDPKCLSCKKLMVVLAILLSVELLVGPFLQAYLNFGGLSSLGRLTGYAEKIDQDINSGFKFNMSYIHFNDKNSYLKYVENTNDALSEVAPAYFCLDRLGSLQISSTLDKKFIDEMHNRGIKVVPYLSNNWDRTVGRFALAKRRKLSEEIAQAVEKYNLDGVNIDIEDLTEQDRDRHTDFIKLLRKNLGPDKIIAVSVASNPRGITTGWHGSYDYEGLAKYSDYLMLMTYDEHYGGSSAGPVASIGFVEESIEYALKYVPKEKIVMGIPFYGRIWKNGGGLTGRGISLREASSLIARYEGKVTFNNAYLSPKATFTIKSKDEKATIYGAQLKSGSYTIWYENEDSLKYKLSLVKKYGIKGTGSWSLGQEPQSIWKYYSLWLNGQYYSDIQGHWAQNPIIYAMNKGLLTTKELKTGSGFAPETPITRAEAAVALVRAFGLEKDRTQGSQVLFTDISNHWAKNEIEIASQNKVINGSGDGKFNPDHPLSREEISIMLDRLITTRDVTLASRGNSSSTTTLINTTIAYKDVNRDSCDWSYDSIIRMSQQGILQGSSDGNFNPKTKVSRAEMAVLLHRMLAE